MAHQNINLLTEVRAVNDPRNLDVLSEFNRQLFTENAFQYWMDVRVTTHATANTEFRVVADGLGRTPTGYLIIKKDKAVDVYTGATSWTTDKLYLKATVSSAIITVRVIG